jgi:hypothetical protein
VPGCVCTPPCAETSPVCRICRQGVSFQRSTPAIAVGQHYRMTAMIRNIATPNAPEYRLPAVSGAGVIDS